MPEMKETERAFAERFMGHFRDIMGMPPLKEGEAPPVVTLAIGRAVFRTLVDLQVIHVGER